MQVEQIVDVPENGEVTIQLPDALKNSKRIKIVINEIDAHDDWDAKIALLQKAATDPLFLADMKEVARDFEGIESKIEE